MIKYITTLIIVILLVTIFSVFSNKYNVNNINNDYSVYLMYEGKINEAEYLLLSEIEDPKFQESNNKHIIYSNLASLYEISEEKDLAIEYYKKARDLFNESDSKYYSYNAQINLQEGKIGEALDALGKAININPDNFDANNLLGLLYLGEIEGVDIDLDRALEYNEKAYKLNPSPYIIENLAINYYFIGEYKKSFLLFKKLNKINPNNILSNYYLGLLYLIVDRNIEYSQELLRGVIEVDPYYDNSEIQNILNM